jgi:hypothetical protein
MANTFLGYELGKVYFENQYRDHWGVWEFIDNLLIHTRYQSALIQELSNGSESYAGRFMQRTVWGGDFEFDNNGRLMPEELLFDIGSYGTSWDRQNDLTTPVEGINYKSNSQHTDYGWWDNTPLTSVINSEIATQKIIGNSYDYTYKNLGSSQYQFKLETASTYDSLTGITTLKFTDKTIDVDDDIKGVFDQVTGLNTDDAKMFRLYNASFKRLPDPDGLKYWIGNFSSGIDDERAVSSSFLASAEFKQRYGENITHETYVQNLYLNVLNRELDQGGYDYWVGNLNNGIEQRHEVLLGFSESAENKLLFTEMTGFA